MLDASTPKGRIISAALDCAAAKPWGEVTLVQEAHNTSNPKDQGNNQSAQHEFETPAPWRKGLLGR